MCLNGEPRPIPKGEIEAWKLVKVRGIITETYYPLCDWHGGHNKGFQTNKWLSAENEESRSYGFHAYAQEYQALGELIDWRRECHRTICTHVRLRGIIEATSEGYRAREMYIPKTRKGGK